ncbi:inverse autotransporter beta domain-containing protein [Aliamphritea ceti]|uniref:inverse autotransporter beta domain-containing protein n=1 Tax=Aliamphritea ceti TaxID=1524258 RepID=UPI0021C39C01|nr:inverse autotransporter beta domain-containing protein [Aliamphritea ceti]
MLALNPALFGKTISTCLVISSIALVQGVKASQSEENKWQPWLEVGGFAGSDNASRGEAALFVPLYQAEDRMLFTELRGKLFTEGSREGNVALGYRQMLDSGWNLGGWVGLDQRVSTSDNRFRQVAAGLEALSADWGLRFNGYYPLSDAKAYNTPVTAQVVGNQIFITGAAEVPLHGVDFEAGYRLPINVGTGSELWLHGGAFWFDDDLAAEPVTGPKLRAEWRFNDIFAALPGSSLVLETGYSHDKVRDDNWEFGLKLKIPLITGKPNRFKSGLSVQETRMLAALERDTDIVSADSGREAVEDAATGTALTQVAFAKDDASLTQAISEGSNTLIVLDGSAGALSGGRVMAAKQTLLGGGSRVQLTGAKTGGSGVYTASGSRPQITHTANTPVFQVADGNHFIGLNVTGAGFASGSIFNHGFSDRNVTQEMTGAVLTRQTLVFDDLNITDVGGAGIRLGGASDLTLRANSINIQQAGGSGIDFTGPGGLVSADTVNLDTQFNNITLHDIGLTGIDFRSSVNGFKSGKGTLSFNGLNISNTGEDGVRMLNAFNQFANGTADFEIAFKNVAIENVGIVDLAANGFSMSNMFDQFDGGNGKLVLDFDNVAVSKTPGTAIAFNGAFDEFNNANADIQIAMKNINIADAGFAGSGEGIYFGGGLDEFIGSTLAAKLTLSNITINRTADDGINLQVFDELSDSTLNAQLLVENVTAKDIGILNPNADAIDMSGAYDETTNSTVNSTTILRNILVDGASNGIDISHAYDEITNSRGNASLQLSGIQVRNVVPGYGVSIRDSFNQFTGIQAGALGYQVALDNILVDGSFDAGVSFNGSGDNLAISRQLIMRNLNLTNTGTPVLDLTNLQGFIVTQQ